MPPTRRMEEDRSRLLGLPTPRLCFLLERFHSYLRKYDHVQRKPVFLLLRMIQCVILFPLLRVQLSNLWLWGSTCSSTEPPVASEPWVMVHRNKTPSPWALSRSTSVVSFLVDPPKPFHPTPFPGDEAGSVAGCNRAKPVAGEVSSSTCFLWLLVEAILSHLREKAMVSHIVEDLSSKLVITELGTWRGPKERSPSLMPVLQFQDCFSITRGLSTAPEQWRTRGGWWWGNWPLSSVLHRGGLRAKAPS